MRTTFARTAPCVDLAPRFNALAGDARRKLHDGANDSAMALRRARGIVWLAVAALAVAGFSGCGVDEPTTTIADGT